MAGEARSFEVRNGSLLQSGVDRARPFYKETTRDDLVIVNVAGRAAKPPRRDEGPPVVYWLPMVEQERVRKCREYLELFGRDLLAHLERGGTVLVHCQEGLFRSVEFAKQLQALAAPELCGTAPAPTAIQEKEDDDDGDALDDV